MTLQEKKLLDSLIATSDSNNSPSSLLLQEGKRRLSGLLSQLDSALTSINLSKFPEISFISSMLDGRLQTTKWTFSSHFTIQESAQLFNVEIFTSHTPSVNPTASLGSSSQTLTDKQLLLTIHINLSVLPDEQSPTKCSTSVSAKLFSFCCSQSLARLVVSEVVFLLSLSCLLFCFFQSYLSSMQRTY
jgi:hypothetical protein